MRQAFRQLDHILRGEATQLDSLKAGRIDIPVTGLAGAIALLGLFYGACIGAYTVIRTGGELYMQVLASAVKLPLLFFLTLIVTFPSLYVFNALVGSRLSMVSVVRLLVAMIGVMLAVLASLGPIVVFFAVSTESYPFMQLLNVVMATVAGVLGLAFLLRTLHRLVTVQEAMSLISTSAPLAASIEADDAPASEPQQIEAEPSDTAADASTPAQRAMRQKSGQVIHQPPQQRQLYRSPLERDEVQTDRRARTVFRIWVIVFALVGAQMSWVLRPFIGSPDLPFAWFRVREGNFFMAVLQALRALLGIDG